MTRRIAEASLQRTARVAGLAYLLTIVTSMFFVMFVELGVLVPATKRPARSRGLILHRDRQPNLWRKRLICPGVARTPRAPVF